MSITVELDTSITSPWTEMTPVRLGDAQSVGVPACFARVVANGLPLLRLDVYANPGDALCFQEAIAWSSFVAIGHGESVYIVRTADKSTTELALGAYFGHFYTADENLLIASAERLFCLRPDGSLAWKSEMLGIDGVVVHSTAGGHVLGAGEWDPPGGWRQFCLSSTTGELLESAA